MENADGLGDPLGSRETSGLKNKRTRIAWILERHKAKRPSKNVAFGKEKVKFSIPRGGDAGKENSEQEKNCEREGAPG